MLPNILLVASTALAATFCYLYLTKPVLPAPIVEHAPTQPSMAKTDPPANPATKTPPAKAGPRQEETPLLPSGNSLPGDPQVAKAPSSPANSSGKIVPAPPTQSSASPYEETNLRIQHILSAKAPEGELGRIVVDVPVLYQSRNLRWSAKEAAKARQLLAELDAYQQKSRSLRLEGDNLLQRWNSLVQVSVPEKVLRADSPTLPENQTSAAPDAKMQSSDAIRVEPKR